MHVFSFCLVAPSINPKLVRKTLKVCFFVFRLKIITPQNTNSKRYLAVITPETSSTKAKPIHVRSRSLGIFYAIFCGVGQVVVMTILKYLRNFTTSELNLYQAGIEFFFILPFFIFDGTKFVFLRFAFLLLLRGFIVTVRFYSRIFATQKLPLAEANIIYFSGPLFVVIALRIFLKERFTKASYICLAAIFVGLNLISRFWELNDVERALGLGTAFLSVIFSALGDVAVKKLTNLHLDAKLLILHVVFFRSICMAFVTEITNEFTSPRFPHCDVFYPFQSEPVLLLLMGSCTVMLQFCETEAIRLENPSTVSAIITSIALPCFLIFQLVVFDDTPTVLTIVGTVSILFGSLVMNLARIIDTMPQSSKLKNYCHILNK